MADDVVNRTFATSFRGFDPAEVRAFLAQLSERLDAAEATEAELRKKLREAEARAASPDIDEETLLRLLGDETARVMRSAREAAVDLRAKAEDSVEQILRDAHDEAKRLRAASESVLAERTAEADQAAAQIQRRAEAEAEALLDAARAEAMAEREAVREQAKAMVVEAQAARERILADLTRRRRIAHVQVEQLRAGRDRLLDAYRLVRSTLEEVTDELQRAEHEARAAAEATARRLAGELPPPDDEAGAEPGPLADAEPGAPGPEEPAPEGLDDEGATAEPVEVEGGDGAGEGEGEGEGERPRLVTTTVAVDSPTPVTAEPTHPASVPVEERRLSALRAVRLVEPEPEAESVVMATVELSVVQPTADDEAVRVLPAEEAGSGEQAEPMAATSAPAAEPAPPSKAVVEDLFARIRAGRAEALEEARQVLAEDQGPEEKGEPSEAAEPVAEQAGSDAAVSVSDADELALQRRDEAIADIEAKLARKLKRSLQDDQNDLLDRLRGMRKPDASALGEPAEHAGRHLAVVLPFLAEAAAVAVPEASPDVNGVAAELVDAVLAPLRRQLARAIETGDDEESAAAERVGMAYREWKGDRIERLAGDAVVAAWSRAWFEAAPDGAVLRWVVDDQDGACPDCDDNALAGPTVKGEAYPTGQTHPPAHAGCRCLLRHADT
jgi:DivIVA domain-containing protein